MISIFRKIKHNLVWLILAIAVGLFSIIPVKIAIAFHQTPVPQAIFVLGGILKEWYLPPSFGDRTKI